MAAAGVITKRVYARLTTDLHRQLRIQAVNEGRSVQDIVTDLVITYLSKSNGRGRRRRA